MMSHATEWGVSYPYRQYSCVVRLLRYSINVTLDGCCDHGAIPPDEDLHRYAIENLNQADALLFGRVIYEMMEAAWRPPAATALSSMATPTRVIGTPRRLRVTPEQAWTVIEFQIKIKTGSATGASVSH
jgi:hypothetical protein